MTPDKLVPVIAAGKPDGSEPTVVWLAEADERAMRQPASSHGTAKAKR